jgi:hypothetical protein
MEIFEDHGQSFSPIFTKIGTPSTFMGLRMINMKAINKVMGSQVVVELFTYLMAQDIYF